jgi:hypothetical protein
LRRCARRQRHLGGVFEAILIVVLVAVGHAVSIAVLLGGIKPKQRLDEVRDAVAILIFQLRQSRPAQDGFHHQGGVGVVHSAILIHIGKRRQLRQQRHGASHVVDDARHIQNGRQTVTVEITSFLRKRPRGGGQEK